MMNTNENIRIETYREILKLTKVNSNYWDSQRNTFIQLSLLNLLGLPEYQCCRRNKFTALQKTQVPAHKQGFLSVHRIWSFRSVHQSQRKCELNIAILATMRIARAKRVFHPFKWFDNSLHAIRTGKLGVTDRYSIFSSAYFVCICFTVRIESAQQTWSNNYTTHRRH